MRVQAGRQSGTFGQHLARHFQNIGKHEAQPLAMNGGIGPGSRLVIGPFVIRHTQQAAEIRIVRIQALGKDLQ